MDSLLLKALHCEPTHRPPIWLMRQAGRYMPEYRRLKERYSFLELCKTPELATEVTKLPIERFGPDAAILFADILLILETLGFELGFGQNNAPLVNSKNLLDNIASLPQKCVHETLFYIAETIKMLKKSLNVPLLGFCGAPFTLATYALEGKTSKEFETTRKWMYHQPQKLHQLLQILTDQTIEYLNLQIEAGVDALQIFDSWAGYFSYRDWRLFSHPYLKKVLEALRPKKIPLILFAKGSCALLDDFIELNPSAISLDYSGDLLKLSKHVPPSVALQGNLDPGFLQAPLQDIEKEVKRLCLGMKDRPGYLFNLGHGLLPQTPESAVQCLIQTVQSLDFSKSSEYASSY